MKPSRLELQALGGFILPLLLGWFFIAWFWFVSSWCSNYPLFARSEWTDYVIFVSWLAFIPAASHIMGIVSAFCWQNQGWNEETTRKMAGCFCYLFWICCFPISMFLICSCIGWLVFPAMSIAYNSGIERGQKWIEGKAIDKFIGRKNDWERDEKE